MSWFTLQRSNEGNKKTLAECKRFVFKTFWVNMRKIWQRQYPSFVVAATIYSLYWLVDAGYALTALGVPATVFVNSDNYIWEECDRRSAERAQTATSGRPGAVIEIKLGWDVEEGKRHCHPGYEAGKAQKDMQFWLSKSSGSGTMQGLSLEKHVGFSGWTEPHINPCRRVVLADVKWSLCG